MHQGVVLAPLSIHAQPTRRVVCPVSQDPSPLCSKKFGTEIRVPDTHFARLCEPVDGVLEELQMTADSYLVQPQLSCLVCHPCAPGPFSDVGLSRASFPAAVLRTA